MKRSPALLVVVAVLAAGTSCRTHSTRWEEGEGKSLGVSHVVICWLKRPGSYEDLQRVLKAYRTLIDIPGVTEVTVGTAIPSQRPVVDSSYDVGMVIRFRNEAAMRDYDQYPVHRAAVESTIKPLVERFVVYDVQIHGRYSSPADRVNREGAR
jgi:hypothetical protein